MVTANDLSDDRCNVECVGQRPSLDQWLRLHYIAGKSHAWGGADEMLEDSTADFAIYELARHVATPAPRAVPDPRRLLAQFVQSQSQAGRRLYSEPQCRRKLAGLHAGHRRRHVEASAAVYLWMVPFDVHGLFDTPGGKTAATKRLDACFRTPDGQWALTKAGTPHAELDNEPSVAAPWLYDYAGQPRKTQAGRAHRRQHIWTNAPGGIPGNGDPGEVSSWYVWAALGMYPEIPGRDELLQRAVAEACTHRPWRHAALHAGCEGQYVVGRARAMPANRRRSHRGVVDAPDQRKSHCTHIANVPHDAHRSTSTSAAVPPIPAVANRSGERPFWQGL